jgi:NNP family nitrate/nitrite transporter-like MFS transporter
MGVNMKKTKYSWVILFVISIAIFTPSYIQYQLSPIAADVIHNYSLSQSQFAGIFSAPMIPAVFLSLVAGMLVDRFGVKKIIFLSIIVTVIGAAIRVFALNYGMLFMAMMLTGISATFLNTNGAKILGSWFPKEKIGVIMGIFLAASNIGMTLGLGTTALFSSIKIAFIIALLISLVTSLLWIILMKEPYVNEEKEKVSIIECLKVVTKNRAVWCVAVCLMFVMGGNVIISTFLPSALSSRGIDTVSAGLISMIVTIGYLVGSIVAPIIAAKFKDTRRFIALLGGIAVILTIFAWMLPQGILLSLGLFALGIAIGGLIPILMSIPICLPDIGAKYAGTAGGFVCTIQLFGAVVLPTYVITPLASNMLMMFALAGISVAFVCVLCIFLPTRKMLL